MMFNNLFSKKVKVTFIDDSTHNVIGESYMQPDQLPETFEVATTMTLSDQEWSVVKASPANSMEFTKSRNLVLRLRKIEYLNPQNILYTLPTISNEFPPISETSAFTEFEFTIHEDDWRQREFLTRSALPVIDIEMEGIRHVWENDHQKIDDKFNAFTNVHVRSKVGRPLLKLSLESMLKFLSETRLGQLKISGQGTVENGFVLKTEFTTYYGIVIDNTIRELSIVDYGEGTNQEIILINREYDLVFVDWCNSNVITDHD
jgi:hypothetical protein